MSSPTGSGQLPYAPQGGNDSGLGAQSVLPAELRGLNWGAFLLNWIWSIGNQSWFGLLCLVPYVGIIMQFVLLFKGNEWAWQNRKWDSTAQFREVQGKWTMWGVIIFVAGLVLGIIGIVLLGAIGANTPRNYTPSP
ncbi:hypothetical protein EON80_00685 [bacterium]|nr:MAG: hypothetical protein EON80_00685 [bacterium]